MRGAPKKRPGNEKAQKTSFPLPSPSGLSRLVAGGPLERFTKIKRCNIPFLAGKGQGS